MLLIPVNLRSTRWWWIPPKGDSRTVLTRATPPIFLLRDRIWNFFFPFLFLPRCDESWQTSFLTLERKNSTWKVWGDIYLQDKLNIFLFFSDSIKRSRNFQIQFRNVLRNWGRESYLTINFFPFFFVKIYISLKEYTFTTKKKLIN